MTPVPWAAWRKQQGYGERSLASYINIRTTTLVKPTQHLCVASQSQYGVDDGVGGLPRPLLKLGKGGVAHLEPLGSGCRIRKGEQRHGDYYHSFIALRFLHRLRWIVARVCAAGRTGARRPHLCEVRHVGVAQHEADVGMRDRPALRVHD